MAWFCLASFVCAVLALVAGIICSRLQKCPRCSARGYGTVLVVGVDGGDGTQPNYHVDHVSTCRLYRVVCRSEIKDVAPDVWKQEAEAFATEVCLTSRCT